MCRSMTSCLKEGTPRMTGTPEISLPDSLKAFVKTQVESGGYHSASDYICALIRQDQKSKLEQTLSRLLLEGLESGQPLAADAAFWATLRQELEAG
jgi:antitoxin ParD1/3/4